MMCPSPSEDPQSACSVLSEDSSARLIIGLVKETFSLFKYISLFTILPAFLEVGNTV